MAELILALDVTEKRQAKKIVKACAPHLDAVKLGYPLILSCGLSFAGELEEFDLPLIADFKVADIPNTNRLIAEQVFDAGFSSIICHGFTGQDAVQACVDVAADYGGSCFVVAEMSHPGATTFFHGGTAEKIAELTMACGADGIIAPATRPDRVTALRKIVGSRKILSPGVGAQGGDAAAVAKIVDGIIVGRAIYDAENPKAAAESFATIRGR
ncbi:MULTISPECIES: orotidine-5'-phosphate decarboxylase [unclassified Methanoregula]|uniref:orotidine-5'-phosphate decarboxylase n=1 Tax=unclassified Methanoregula TaxID=2649730 RepID=UPI0009C9A15F|nr:MULTISPECIES: orotidine-5'-phosphate decarboxylase [unclassified Methanoregula]OPX61779.1 MAG: Orotidine 5'-phosphate decarboxylase [Methanoregula sp. PtaB.Bin085]OPY33912.1 MAG: Orotidine 5'-phosphate decarboxylase [Methanoregula sp. PtaU1.Bin006]